MCLYHTRYSMIVFSLHKSRSSASSSRTSTMESSADEMLSSLSSSLVSSPSTTFSSLVRLVVVLVEDSWNKEFECYSFKITRTDLTV